MVDFKAMRLTAPLITALALALAGCNQSSPPPSPPAGATNAKPSAEAVNSQPDKVQQTDVKVGTGSPVKAGDDVWVTYTGTLPNGTEFDSNVDKDPFHVT